MICLVLISGTDVNDNRFWSITYVLNLVLIIDHNLLIASHNCHGLNVSIGLAISKIAKVITQQE